MLVLSTGNVAVPIYGWSVMSIGCRFRLPRKIPFTHRTEDSKTQTGHCQVFFTNSVSLHHRDSFWILLSLAWLYKMKIFKFKKPWHLKDPWYFLEGGKFPSQDYVPGNKNPVFPTFGHQVIPGASDKLMIFFQGGGACFNDVSTRQAASCLAIFSWCTAWLIAVALGRSCR